MSNYSARIAQELSIQPRQATAVIELLDGGATVPFIARYRKEATGSLDEVAITAIRDRSIQMKELDERRAAILKSLEERGLLTDELKDQILAADTMTLLEDIYLPFRPKRKTRASAAREKGLEPLAQMIFEQGPIDPMVEALTFVDAEKGVESAEDALSGARDIIAEWISENLDARATIRAMFQQQGVFRSKVGAGKEETGVKFKDYFDWEEPIATAPSHRVLAMRRGENEEVLNLRILIPEDMAELKLEPFFIKASNAAAEQVREALRDGYKRLMMPSMETEMRVETKRRADAEAIRVFSENLRELMLAAPLGQKNVLAIDPGYRTGCKTVCLDRQGKLLHHDVIFLSQGDRSERQAAEMVMALCARFQIEAIAIGNGTASRETDAFVRKLPLPSTITIVLVNESGASIYSASDVAREEFPDQDVTVRGAVSIGRRLMDPLAELVKIDPKSIGVGQYQHDVEQTELKKGLDDVVTSCVNNVGVEVNTASKELLTYVSGLGPHLAKNIVEYRNENGPFRSRKALLKVPRLGPKAFEQAAGFLRIRDAENPLDASAVHPETYPIVDKMAKDLGCSIDDLIKTPDIRRKIKLQNYISDTIGLPTLTDIMTELEKPGRDPRHQFEVFRFADGIEKMEDLKPGMSLPGIVTNVTAFGAFVDIGVHQDGLVHISQLADGFVKNPSDVVKVHQKVKATVLEVDAARKRISLTLKTTGGTRATGPAGQPTEAPGRQAQREDGARKQSYQPLAKSKEEKFGNNPFAKLLKSPQSNSNKRDRT